MKKRKRADTVGEYFQLYMDSVWRIVDCGGGALQILCYIALSRGAGASQETGWSTTALSLYLQITRKKAEEACKWLIEMQVVSPINKFEPNMEDCFPSQWKVIKNGKAILMPNSIIGEDRDIGPLGKLYHSIGKQSSMLDADTAKLLQVMILLCFYEHYDLEDCGGVSPKIWTREWPIRDEPGQFAIPGGGYLASIEPGKPKYQERLISWLSRSGVLPSRDQETYLRNALMNLVEKQLINETVYVWDGGPELGTLRYALCHLAHWMRAEKPMYLIEQISQYCEDNLSIEDISKFEYQGKLYDIPNRRFLMIGFDGYRASSSMTLKHEPKTLDQKISRSSISSATLEFLGIINNLTTVAQGGVVLDDGFY